MAKIPASVFVVAGILFLCLILVVVGTIIPDWLNGDFTVALSTGAVQTYTRKIGLWRTCGSATATGTSTTCLLMLDEIERTCTTFKSTFQWLQGLSVTACVCLFLGMILIPISRATLRQPIMVCGGFFVFVAWVCMLVVIILFKVDVQDDTSVCSGVTQLIPKPADLSAGWILFVVAAVFTFIALTFSFWFCFRGSAGGQRPPTADDKNQPLMTEYYQGGPGYYGGPPQQFPPTLTGDSGYYGGAEQSYEDPYAGNGGYGYDPSYSGNAYDQGYQPPVPETYAAEDPYAHQGHAPASYPPAVVHPAVLPTVVGSYTPPGHVSPPRAAAYSPYQSPRQDFPATVPARDPLLDRLAHVRGKLANTLESDTRRSLSPQSSYRRMS